MAIEDFNIWGRPLEDGDTMSFDENQRRQIIEVMDEILKSPGLSNSPQLQSFLKYIVIKTLDGEQDRLKGYSIGVDALGKGEAFDPSTDPSVRVTAGRLRQALTSFFLENPEIKGPVISLPKGSYVPEFVWDETAFAGDAEYGLLGDQVFPPGPPLSQHGTSALAIFMAVTALALSLLTLFLYLNHQDAAPDLPQPLALGDKSAKLPSIYLSMEFDENGLPEWQSPRLTETRTIIAFNRFNEYRFIRGEPTAEEALSADYNLKLFFSKGTVSEDLYFVTTVSRGDSGEIIWSGNTTLPRPTGADEQENRETVFELVSAIMSPYGIIYGDIVNRPNPPNRLDCIRNIYEYFSTESLQAYSTGLACAQKATGSGTASSSMHAMLAFLYVEAHRRLFADVAENPIREAKKEVKRSIELDEANARAYQARFAVEKVSQNPEGALAAAKMAIERNPFDRDIIGDYAAYLISIGRLAEAEEPLRRALRLTPRRPAWLTFHEYLLADLSGKYDKADAIVAGIEPDSSPLLSVAVLLAATRNTDQKRIDDAEAHLAKTEPGFLDNPEEAFLRRGFTLNIAECLAYRITKARFKDCLVTPRR